MGMTAGNGWAVARAWAERMPFDYATLADIAGVTEITARNMAKRQGWRVRAPGDARETLARMRERLWERIDYLTATGPMEPFDKTGIEAVHVLMRAIGRIEQTLPEGADVDGSSGADEMASVLRRIDERIQELAGEMSCSGNAGSKPEVLHGG